MLRLETSQSSIIPNPRNNGQREGDCRGPVPTGTQSRTAPKQGQGCMGGAFSSSFSPRPYPLLTGSQDHNGAGGALNSTLHLPSIRLPGFTVSHSGRVFHSCSALRDVVMSHQAHGPHVRPTPVFFNERKCVFSLSLKHLEVKAAPLG